MAWVAEAVTPVPARADFGAGLMPPDALPAVAENSIGELGPRAPAGPHRPAPRVSSSSVSVPVVLLGGGDVLADDLKRLIGSRHGKDMARLDPVGVSKRDVLADKRGVNRRSHGSEMIRPDEDRVAGRLRVRAECRAGLQVAPGRRRSRVRVEGAADRRSRRLPRRIVAHRRRSPERARGAIPSQSQIDLDRFRRSSTAPASAASAAFDFCSSSSYSDRPTPASRRPLRLLRDVLRARYRPRASATARHGGRLVCDGPECVRVLRRLCRDRRGAEAPRG